MVNRSVPLDPLPPSLPSSPALLATLLFTLSQAFLAFSARTQRLGEVPCCWLPYSQTRNVTYHFALLHPPVKPFVIPQKSGVTQDTEHFLRSLWLLTIHYSIPCASPAQTEAEHRHHFSALDKDINIPTKTVWTQEKESETRVKISKVADKCPVCWRLGHSVYAWTVACGRH